jgi:hypothetical protein
VATCERIILAAFLMVTGSGIAAAQNATPQTKTSVGPGAPVISADSPPARNPAVNPSAAGLSQPATAAPHAGHNYRAATQPGIGQDEFSASQALASLRYYGYSGITNLHLNQNRHWQAQATHNGRRVKVVLDDRGTATEMK